MSPMLISQFQSLGEPLFELPLSGWYRQITRTDTEKGAAPFSPHDPDAAPLWRAARVAAAPRASDRSCAAQRTARRRRRDRMGNAPARPVHSRPVHLADDLRHLAYGAAGRLAAAEAQDQFRADPRPRHHAKPRRKPACRRGGTGQPRSDSGSSPHKAGVALALGIPGEAVMGLVGPRIRQRHRRARLSARRRSRRRDRGRQRGRRLLLRRAPPQPADQHRDAGTAGGAQRSR